MEGYYPIQEYCKLTNTSRDTAYHRAIRKEVDSFKNKNNRLFIYFNDEIGKIPDRFISMEEYAKINGFEYSTIRNYTTNGRIKQEDIFRIDICAKGNTKRNRTYINKDAKILYKPTAKDKCPEGYLPVKEWADKYNISKERLSQMILLNRITTIKVKSFRYIKEDALPPEDRRHYNKKRKEI